MHARNSIAHNYCRRAKDMKMGYDDFIASHAANGKKRQGKLVVDEIEKNLADGRFQ
jgi:hypothetical protein